MLNSFSKWQFGSAKMAMINPTCLIHCFCAWVLAWIGAAALLPSYCFAAHTVVLEQQGESHWSGLESSQRWVCKIVAGELGWRRLVEAGRSDGDFKSLNIKRFRQRIRKKLTYLRAQRPESTRLKQKLNLRIRAQRKLRRELGAAIKECRALTTPNPPGVNPAPTPIDSPTDPSPAPSQSPSHSPSPDFSPTPEPTPYIPGTGQNPYYSAPTWKIWAEDESPVTLNSETYSLPIAEADRLYPDWANSSPWPGQFLATAQLPVLEAGFWDDAYKSEDDAHTMIRTSWSIGAAALNLSGQFIRLNIGDMGPAPAHNMALGVNFTSQSTTCMGHNLVQGSNITYNEKQYYFAATLRGGPAYYSYRDHLSERSIDSYEALPVFGFHSFGRSGSETNGLLKMLAAGGYLPRNTKNQLKRAGVYPAALLYLYKATLPYANADGSPVSYENELRHRVGYLSNGNSSSSEFMPYNEWYHRYNEGLHFYEMTQLANSMSVAPPVAVIRFIEGRRIAGNGTESTFTSNWDAGVTVVKSRLDPGETVALTIDVGDSYDLQERDLIPKWQVLYPEQKNVSISHQGGTLYTIRAQHSSALPKGRIPVLFTVSNGVYDSNPAVVSFFPANSAGCWSYQLGANPADEVNVNLRPLLESSAVGDITVSAGSTASFSLNCSDPEGFPTRLYRWLGEPGTLVDDTFYLPTSTADAGKTFSLHFICSDGTGGYNSLEQKVIVQ